jgi:hypothetical protein
VLELFDWTSDNEKGWCGENKLKRESKPLLFAYLREKLL